MNFKPDEKNIRSLLKSGCQFVIPRFQREYSWDKKNYQEFFEDMMNKFKRTSEDKISDLKRGNESRGYSRRGNRNK